MTDISATTAAATDRFMNVVQTAGLLQVHPTTLGMWRCYGLGGPTFIKRKRRIYYPLSGLKAFAKAKGYELTELEVQNVN